MGSEKEVDINVKLKIFQQILSRIIMTLADKVRKETLLKFCNILVTQILLYGSKCWTLTERQKGRQEAGKFASWELCQDTDWSNTGVMKILV
jgi:hypothetical protein